MISFGDSCMIYLHQEYALDPHVRDSVTEQISIKLLGKKHNAHLVHQAAHSVAVGFACYKLRPYEDVVAPGDGQPADDGTHTPDPLGRAADSTRLTVRSGDSSSLQRWGTISPPPPPADPALGLAD